MDLTRSIIPNISHSTVQQNRTSSACRRARRGRTARGQAAVTPRSPGHPRPIHANYTADNHRSFILTVLFAKSALKLEMIRRETAVDEARGTAGGGGQQLGGAVGLRAAGRARGEASWRGLQSDLF